MPFAWHGGLESRTGSYVSLFPVLCITELKLINLLGIQTHYTKVTAGIAALQGQAGLETWHVQSFISAISHQLATFSTTRRLAFFRQPSLL